MPEIEVTPILEIPTEVMAAGKKGSGSLRSSLDSLIRSENPEMVELGRNLEREIYRCDQVLAK